MANSGVNVADIDVSAANDERINRGEVAIVEPGLQEELTQALESGRFHATTEQVHANAYIIAVLTPFTDTHNVDMKFIYSAAESIASQLKSDELIVLESTSPPQTTAKIAKRLLELRPDLATDCIENTDNKPVIYFAHCPQRILPGKAVEELWSNNASSVAELRRQPAAPRRFTLRSVTGSFCPLVMSLRREQS